METANHECYVSVEVAKLLRTAGFDWEVNHSYPNCEPLDNSCSGYMEDLSFYHNLNDGKYGGISVPTLEIAQKWLREVRREYVVVHPIVNKWFYSIHRPNFGHYYRDKKFSTYEEAQEAGIKKVLEIILHKE